MKKKLNLKNLDDVMNKGYITPLIIDIKDESWDNPDIEKLCVFSPDKNNGGLIFDKNVFRIVIVTEDDKSIHMVVKSNVLEQYYNKFDFDLDDIRENYNRLRTETNIIEAFLDMSIPVVLLEDVWKPDGKQFCFTMFGKKISDMLLGKEITISYSPDIGLQKYDDGTYGWST